MNRYTERYSYRHLYSAQQHIEVPVTFLSGSGTKLRLTGIIDTGSTFCVLRRQYADYFGLDLTQGIPQRISTAAGSFTAYGHELIIQLFDFQWEAIVYFHESENFSRNILGRIGFIDHLRIGLVDYDETLFVGLYNENT